MKKYVTKAFVPFFLIFLLITGILIINNDFAVSLLLPFAPLFYGLMFFVVYQFRYTAFDSFVVLIIFVMWFVRLVVNPCIFVLSGYATNIRTPAGTDNLEFAVLLMCYELFAVTIYLVSSKKISSITVSDTTTEQNSDRRIKQIVKWIIVLLFLLACLAILVDRRVIVSVSTIFQKLAGHTESTRERVKEPAVLKSETNLAFELFVNCVYYLQILIPACLLSFTVDRHSWSGKTSKGYWLSLFAVLSAVLITTDDNINSVCILMAALLVVFYNYRKKMDKHIPLLVLGLGVFILAFLFSKVGFDSKNAPALHDISIILNAYFSALPNVSVGFSTVIEDKLATFFGDVVSGVPYMMFFFRGYPQSVTFYNEAVYGYSGMKNQIMPLISAGYQYLGVLAPAFTVFIYSVALKMEERMKRSRTILNQMIYAVVAVNLSVGPCIFSLPSHIKRLCLFVPLLILAYINKRGVHEEKWTT